MIDNRKEVMPLSVADYIADTAHLSTEQHGACMLLMMHLHYNGELPSDDKGLSRVARLPLVKWRRMRTTVLEMVNALPKRTDKKGARQ